MLIARQMIAVAALCLLMSLSALADEKNQGRLTLSDPAMIGTTQLKPGDYKVEWDGTGPNVQVRIMKGHQSVATATAKLVEHEKSSAQNAVVLKQTKENSMAVEEIDFGNRREALVLDETAAGE